MLKTNKTNSHDVADFAPPATILGRRSLGRSASYAGMHGGCCSGRTLIRLGPNAFTFHPADFPVTQPLDSM